MKGCSSLKKVIDITLRKGENGVSGRVGLFGDTYGGGKGIVSVLSQQDKLRILTHIEATCSAHPTAVWAITQAKDQASSITIRTREPR